MAEYLALGAADGLGKIARAGGTRAERLREVLAHGVGSGFVPRRAAHGRRLARAVPAPASASPPQAHARLPRVELRDIGEFGLIERIERAAARRGGARASCSGSATTRRCCASAPASSVVASTDAFVEGVHFRLRSQSPRGRSGGARWRRTCRIWRRWARARSAAAGAGGAAGPPGAQPRRAARGPARRGRRGTAVRSSAAT